MSEDNQDFIDNGVADIADSLGLVGSNDADEFENNSDLQGGEDDVNSEAGSDKKDEESQESYSEDGSKEGDSQVQVKPAPQSWAKEKHEIWVALPDDAKEYIELREQQMLDGIEQYKQGYQYAEWIDQAIAPFREDLKAAGVDEATGIMNLLQHHRSITQGTLEQRQQAFIQIGIASGLIPQENAPKVDPVVNQLQQEINALKMQEQERAKQHENAVRLQVEAQINEFSKDKPDFNDLAGAVAQFISMGHSLESAYEQAKWANPKTRQAEIDRIAAERAAKANESALKAKKAASVNVRPSRSSGRPAAPLGTWEDTMQETLNNMRAKA